MSLKILIVDDSSTDRDNLRTILSNKGYAVIEAHDGLTGIEVANKEQPDLIFLDVVMPGKSGYEICRAIKKDARTKAIPVILVTSKNEKVDKVMGELQGASGHIGKPATEAEILAAVSNYGF